MNSKLIERQPQVVGQVNQCENKMSKQRNQVREAGSTATAVAEERTLRYDMTREPPFMNGEIMEDSLVKFKGETKINGVSYKTLFQSTSRDDSLIPPEAAELKRKSHDYIRTCETPVKRLTVQVVI
jgi:hypothetical protein